MKYITRRVRSISRGTQLMIERTNNVLTQFFLAVIEIEGICQLRKRPTYCSHVVSEETTTQRSRDSQSDDKPRRKLQRGLLRLLPTTAGGMHDIVVVDVIRITNSSLCRMSCICTQRHCGPSSFLDELIITTFASSITVSKRYVDCLRRDVSKSKHG